MGRTAVTLDELADLERAAERLTMVAAMRDEARLAAAARTRQRAFTLFVRGYSEIRRTVLYLRFYEGDGNELAPSLRVTRGRRGPAP